LSAPGPTGSSVESLQEYTMILGDFGSLARLSFGSSLLLPALCYSCAAFEFMRRQSSNQALQLTPFDCRSGQANWAGAMTRFDFMRELSMLRKLAPASAA